MRLLPPFETLWQETLDTSGWLGDAGKHDRGTIKKFLSSRVVYYPGAGNDWQALELFGGAHAACCFVHADYKIGTDEVKAQLQASHPHHLRGYAPIETATHIFPSGEFPMDPPLDLEKRFGGDHEPASILWSVLERQNGFREEHVPDRIAFMHFTAEAVWTYWNLWARFKRAPYAMVLQDHGFGGNWMNFGDKQGPLYQLAAQSGLPDWLLVADNTKYWSGFQVASDWSLAAGSAGHKRRLWRRTSLK